MPYANEEPLRFLPTLLLGVDELQYMQGRNDENARRYRLAMFERLGFIIPPSRSGHIDMQWHVAEHSSGGGNLTVNQVGTLPAPNSSPPLLAIDADGYLCEFDGDGDTIVETVPDDGVWYTLIARRTIQTLGPGTLEFTSGSNVVTGNLTKFERYTGYTDEGYERGTKIRVDPGDTAFPGNAQTYEIDTIVSDVELHLRTAIGVPSDTESAVPFHIAGEFEGTPTDFDIHGRWVLEFSLVTRTVTPPSPGDLLIADVMYDSGAYGLVKWIDKRAYNTAIRRQLGTNDTVLVVPSYEETPGTGVARHPDSMRVLPAVDNTHVSMAPASFSGGGLVAVFTETPNTRCVVFDPASGWISRGVVDAGSAVTPHVLRIPKWDTAEPTHQLFYVKAGIIYVRPVINDFTSVGAEVAIWQATSVDPADDLDAPYGIVLLNKRIILVAAYYDDSAAAGAGQWQLRFIYSDDNAATWQTNGNEGYTWVASVFTIGPTYYDTIRPCLAQAPNGRIVGAWEDAGTVRWKASFYDYTLDDDPSTVSVTRAGTSIPLDAATQLLDPDIWTDGYAIVVVCTATTLAAYRAISYSVVGYDKSAYGTSATSVGKTQRLFTVDLTAATADPLSVSLAHVPGWMPMIAYIDTNHAPNWVPQSDALNFMRCPNPASIGY